MVQLQCLDAHLDTLSTQLYQVNIHVSRIERQQAIMEGFVLQASFPPPPVAFDFQVEDDDDGDDDDASDDDGDDDDASNDDGDGDASSTDEMST